MQPRLRGRRRECEVLDDLLASVRTGREPGARPSRRGGDRQDSAARPSRRQRVRLPGRAGGGRRVRDGARPRGAAPALRAVRGSDRELARPAARRARHRVRTARRRRAEPVPRRPGRPRPALRCGGGEATAVDRGRRSVARRGLVADARVRGAPPRSRVGRHGGRDARPRPRGRLRRARRARRPRARGARRACPARDGADRPARRPRPRPPRGRDAWQSAGAARAAARADARGDGRRLRPPLRVVARPAASRRASAAGSRRSRPRRGCCCSSLQRSRSATRCRYGARRARSGWSRRRGSQRPTSSSSADRCASAIRSSDPRCTGPRRRRSASARTARWPTRRTRKSIPTAAPGTARTRPRQPTRTLPPSSSARPAAHRAAAAWPRPRPSSSARRS